MTPERWTEIQQHLDVALSLGLGERVTFLETLGTTDAELKHEVESLLAGEFSDPNFMDTPALDWLKGSSHEAQLARSPLAGQILGAYRVTNLLGTGGMGKVWRARDTRLNRTVAIKLAHEPFSERFDREARAVAALNHPNICQLYDVGALPTGESYLVMEHIEGAPLAPVDGPRKLLDLATQIADAMAAAHTAGSFTAT